MKAIQDLKLGSHTFPWMHRQMSAPGMVDCRQLQACVCGRGSWGGGGGDKTNLSAWSGCQGLWVWKMCPRPGQVYVFLSTTACCCVVPDLKSFMAKSRPWGQLRILSEDCQWLRNQSWCFQGRLMRFRVKGGCLGRQQGRSFHSSLEESYSIL